MGKTRNDNIIAKAVFWAFDKATGKRADQTGICICIEEKPWAVYAVDAYGCDRVFLRHKFRFEVVI